nr:peptidoglycan-binding domain-containing protein [Scytonema sp. UIC 10036]
MPQLKKGTNGDAVRLLQQQLITFGYLNSSSFDSKFGSVTEAAVQQFQRDRNLKDDGLVGSITWLALANWANHFCQQVAP